MQLPKWVQRHPLLSGFLSFLITVFVVIPTTVAGVWSFWSDEPFAMVAQRSGYGWFVVGPYYGWFSLVVVVASFGLLCVLIGITLKSSSAPPSAAGTTPDDERLRMYEALDTRNNGKTITFLVAVQNKGATDTFVAQSTSVLGFWTSGFMRGGPVIPAAIKWQGTTSEKVEIVKGQTRYLELCVFEHDTMENGDLLLPKCHLVHPHGDVEAFSLMSELPGVASNEIKVRFEVRASDGTEYRRTASVIVVIKGKNSHYYARVSDNPWD